MPSAARLVPGSCAAYSGRVGAPPPRPGPKPRQELNASSLARDEAQFLSPKRLPDRLRAPPRFAGRVLSAAGALGRQIRRNAHQRRACDLESIREAATDQPSRASGKHTGKTAHATATAAASHRLDRNHGSCRPPASDPGHGVGMRGMSGCLPPDAPTRTRRLHPVRLLREPSPGSHRRAMQVARGGGSAALPGEHGDSERPSPVLTPGQGFADGAELAHAPAVRGGTGRNRP